MGGWGLGSHKFKSGKAAKRMDRLGLHFSHIMPVNLGMEMKIGPMIH